jgi:hypothetical protein
MVASKTHMGSFLRAYTHGSGFKAYKAVGNLIDRRKIRMIDHLLDTPEDEKACTDGGSKFTVEKINAIFFEATVCMLNIDANVTTLRPIVPGSSGGGVVDSNGNLMGIVSGGNDHFTMIVRLEEILEFLKPY